MSISFNPLWKTLIDKEMKRSDLIQVAGISSNILAKMGKNDYVSLQSIERICLTLDCDIENVLSVQGSEENNER